MKKVLLIAVLAIAGLANAQKGTILLAGNVGFGSTSKANGVYSGSTFEFAPRVGYQFNDNMTVGLDLGFGNETNQYTNGGTEFKEDMMKVGAFLRYAKSLGGAFSAYADLSIGSKTSKESNNAPGSTAVKYSGMYLGINPAVAIDLKKGFCLNFSVGGLNYATKKAETTNAETGSTFGLTFGQQVNIGISKNF